MRAEPGKPIPRFHPAPAACVRLRICAAGTEVNLKSTPAGALGCLLALLALASCSHPVAPVVVAPVNTTSQIILAEIIGRRLAELGITVDHSHAWDSLADAHQALMGHEADITIEYSGAAWMAVLQHRLSGPQDLPRISALVRSEYVGGQQLKWFDSLGFADPFVLVTRRTEKGRAASCTISGAEGDQPWTLAAGPEFLTRADGFDALMHAYPRLRWANPPATMAASALYGALGNGSANMIASRATDPGSAQADLCMLADDRHLLPPEDASIVARFDSLANHPGMEAALASLSGRISLDQLRRMAAEVEIDHRAPAAVAAEFLGTLPR